MHEMSIALEVCRLVEARLTPREVGRVVGVGLSVGDDAGVEPGNLAFCLEALLAQPPFGSAKPVIARVPGGLLRLDYLEVDDGCPDD